MDLGTKVTLNQYRVIQLNTYKLDTEKHSIKIEKWKNDILRQVNWMVGDMVTSKKGFPRNPGT